MSSASRNSYSLRIVSGVSPEASIPRTCSTAMRISRMMGPPQYPRTHRDAVQEFLFSGHCLSPSDGCQVAASVINQNVGHRETVRLTVNRDSDLLTLNARSEGGLQR